MVRLVEVVEATITTNQLERFSLREIFISPEHVIMVREDPGFAKIMLESKIGIPGLDSNVIFTKLTINRGSMGTDITVIGSSEIIYEKIKGARSKQLLRG